MRLDAYSRALANVRDAVAETYWTETGNLIPEDLALAVGVSAVSAFMAAAKMAVPGRLPPPDPRAPMQVHGGQSHA